MDNSVCNNCALRLYNTKSYNLQGIGNPFYGNCIVVPNVDYKAYKGKSMTFSAQVEIIKEVLSFLTGDIEQSIYIVPFIRCNERISCVVDQMTINNCLYYLAQDIKYYNFKNILLLGDSFRRFFNCNVKDYLDTIILTKNNRRYFANYSPFVKYTDEDLFKIFKEYITKWYNSINSGMFDYNLKML